jgi:hypothetical protein
VAYKDRAAALGPPAERDDRVSGVGMCPIVNNGRVRGSWRRESAGSTVRLRLSYWSAVTREERRAVQAAAERYGLFLGRPVQVA